MLEHEDALREIMRRARQTAVDDSGTQQLLDLSGRKGDKPRKIVRIQDFGLSSVPPTDAEYIMLLLGGGSDRAMALGGEHKDHRPKNTPAGGTVVYDAYGNICSIVQKNVRIVHSKEIRLEAPSIVLAGTVKLGGDDANRPASAQGTTDTHGDTDNGNFATKVFVK